MQNILLFMQIALREWNGMKHKQNKFKWSWLDHVVNIKHIADGRELAVTVEQSGIQKTAVPGKAYCSLCSDLVSYGAKGRIAITDHIKSKNYLDIEKRDTFHGIQLPQLPQSM